MRAHLLGASLLYGHALGAIFANHTPSIDTLGTLQVLNYNDLNPVSSNRSTAAILGYSRETNSGAKSVCSTIGESLYTISGSPDRARLKQLQYQFDYLVHNGDLPPGGSLWVESRHASAHHGCVSYAYDRQELTPVSCQTQLPVLCTSSPPPTTVHNIQPEGYSKISVKAGEYNLVGYRDARSFRFLGIPFADPPVGKLRFMPPQPYSGSKVLMATSFQDSCVQVEGGPSHGDDRDLQFSEDCLYLNVYTPVLPAGNGSFSDEHLRPVAVWLYGGGFTTGSSSSSMYDGGNFASRSDVVTVTFNYRLGALGFLATESLLSGSQAIQDQILALQWVKEHIAAFGGDPERVTIFGESAGAQSVAALLSSSAAEGLFTGAIAQSWPAGTPWFTRKVYTEYLIPQVSSDVGCDNTQSEKELVTCLQSVPAAKFLEVDTNAVASGINNGYLHYSAFVASSEAYLPILDDSNSGVVDDQFYRLLENDQLPNRVPAIFTSMKDEAAAFLDAVPQLGSSQVALDAALSLIYPLDLAYKMVTSGAFLVDSSNPDGVRVALASFITHSEYICSLSHLLDLATETHTFPALYQGLFTRGFNYNDSATPEICFPNAVYNATCHGADVIPVWGTVNIWENGSYDDADGLLHSQVINDIWGAFFHTHDPNPNVHMLKIRGPAYGATYHIFARQGYEIRQFGHDGTGDVNKFSFPPSYTDGPVSPEQCAVFERYGFGFEHAGFSNL